MYSWINLDELDAQSDVTVFSDLNIFDVIFFDLEHIYSQDSPHRFVLHSNIYITVLWVTTVPMVRMAGLLL